MDRNVELVERSEPLRAGARELVTRAAQLSRCLLEHHLTTQPSVESGGRKASA
jgi:hypothetical protein